MNDQVIDVESVEIPEEPAQDQPTDLRDKTTAEITADLIQLKKIRKEIKRVRRYMKSPIHAIRQMDARMKDE